MIRDTVRVMPKHGGKSGGDCRISKQDFGHWKINGPAVGTGWDPRTERAGVGDLLAVDGRSVTFSSFIFCVHQYLVIVFL